MTDSLLVLRQAFEGACEASDSVDLAFAPRCGGAAGTSIQQLCVTYKSGNEYMQLDTLLDTLRKNGKVSVFELRGRGRNEEPALVIDFEHNGETSQLIYYLCLGTGFKWNL